MHCVYKHGEELIRLLGWGGLRRQRQRSLTDETMWLPAANRNCYNS